MDVRIRNVVLVLDVAIMSQLVFFLLPIAEQLSAASTFWHGMNDIMPEKIPPLSALPGSLLSGKCVSLSFSMINGGIAIKGEYHRNH